MAVAHRLRKHADYQRAYARSRKGSTRQITYFFATRGGVEGIAVAETAVTAPGQAREAEQGELGRAAGVAGGAEILGPRVGLTVPKAVGKAHERNRIKRRMREIVRGELGLLGGGAVDVILHPRRSTMEAEFGALRREVAEIFARVTRALAEPAGGVAPRRDGRRDGGRTGAKPGAQRGRR